MSAVTAGGGPSAGSGPYACNLALDGCGVFMLLLFLLPQFSQLYGKGVNRHKRRLLNNAAAIHLFGLLIRFGGSIGGQVGAPDSAQIAFSAIAAVLGIVSAVFAVFCLFCDENGDFRVPRGKAIPIGQIACAVLPPTVAACLMSFLPGVQFMGVAWAIALYLIHSLIMIDSEVRLTETERRLDRTHAAQMAAQMQPHFIFNTLSAIQSLCQTDPAAAAESVENLSGYLRGNIDGLTSEALIPFDTELRHIRQYVALELAGPSRQFAFDYELDVRDFSLPALTVQPIVENAVKHGALTHRDGKGRVLLSTEALGDYIRITVSDNGLDNRGLTDAQRDSRGIGIEATRKRLQALCGGDLQISSDAAGTRAVILIPVKNRG